MQERGLLHLHLVVPFATPRERARAREYVAALDAKREPRNDFEVVGHAAEEGVAETFRGTPCQFSRGRRHDPRRRYLLGRDVRLESGELDGLVR
jgi:hypothetical protein